MLGIIYKTTNLVNGKFYIGQTTLHDENYLGSGDILKKALIKYGRHNFKKETIDMGNTQQQLNESEAYWIKYYKDKYPNLIYNLSEGGQGGNLGEESNIRRVLEFKKNYKKENHPLYHKGYLRKGNKNTFYGKHHTAEAREIIRQANLGDKNPSKLLSSRIKRSKALKGLMVGSKNPMFGMIGDKNPNFRWIYNLADPCGNVYSNITSIRTFCEQHHDLNYKSIIHRWERETDKTIKLYYKHWTFERIRNANKINK